MTWVGGMLAAALFAVLFLIAFLAAWGTIRALIARHTSHIHPPPPAPPRRRAF
jgi:hypothetical protein